MNVAEVSITAQARRKANLARLLVM
jgi:hypothetical protein